MNEKFKGMIAPDWRDSTPDWPMEPGPAEGAPNIVMVVLDDVGFAQLGCYGSNIRTPNIDRLADGGLRLRHFNTVSICSATRSCLLTGRNHHANHMGSVAEIATGFPGHDFRMPKENGTLAEILVEQGWATMAIGKWHLTPAEEHHLGASRKRWPLGRGFERFYGFHGHDTSQFYPDLIHDNHQVAPPRTPQEGYHLSEDLTDKAIEFVRDLHNGSPGKPFFMYFALGAMHTPLHVPDAWLDRYKGCFDEGWDAWREQVYRRQLETGILPAGTELTPRPEWVPAWNSLNEGERRVYARLMEIFAAFLEHSDAQVGRLIDELERMGKLDDTIFMVLSDNGASPEGGRNGSFNNVRYLNGIAQPVEDIERELRRLGTIDSNPHYPYGWAWAGNTPFRRWKQEVHAGGVADPFILHWPKGVKDAGAVRPQYVHAIDVMPTLLELAGVPIPEAVAGVRQAPVHGVSFAHSLDDAAAPTRHHTQYYEMRGCRALYHRGWKAVSYHPRIGLAWDGSDPLRPFSEDRWELYHIDEDFSEMHDLAAQHPQKLASLIEMWWAEAGKYNVLPLDNRGVTRLGLTKPGRYSLGERHVLYPSAGTVREFGAINFRNRSHRIEAQVVVPEQGGDGVLLSMGCGYAGYALFMTGGRLAYVHNYASLAEYEVVTAEPLPSGPAMLALDFTRTGEHKGHVLLTRNGEPAAEGYIEKTIPTYFGGAEMAVGFNPGYGVSRMYRDKGRFAFNGHIDHVALQVRSPAPEGERESLERVAMAIQ